MWGAGVARAQGAGKVNRTPLGNAPDVEKPFVNGQRTIFAVKTIHVHKRPWSE